MQTIAVYGSLKANRYNHDMIKGCNFLGKAVVTGYMYSLGGYPALLDSGEVEHDVELYVVPGLVYDSVYGMEIGAGYVEEVRKFDVKGKSIEATLYVAGKELEEYCVSSREKISHY
jgi:gamma-glutamylcyclotransferase (GGCT)/AIG2-like uncharacterized protein YtfP